MNRTWADAAVEISSEVIGTIGPIGLGVAVIVGTLGLAMWAADRRGWMRPTDLEKKHDCNGCDADKITSMLVMMHGSNEILHRNTQDDIRRFRESLE